MKRVPLRIHYAQKQNLMTIVGIPKVPMNALRMNNILKHCSVS